MEGNITFIWRHAASTLDAKLADRAPFASRPTLVNSGTYPLIPRMPAMNLFDLAISYPINNSVDVRPNVQNLFDNDPPQASFADSGTGAGAWFNTCPTYGSWGRTPRIGIRASRW